MEKVYGRMNVRQDEYEEDGRSRRSPAAIIIMILLILAIAGLLIFSYIRENKTYTTWEQTAVDKPITNASYILTDYGYVAYNCDGAEGHRNDRTILWKVSYNMHDPVAAAAGNYTVIADRGSQTACISDGEGGNYTISVPEEIVAAAVSTRGVTAIRTDAVLSDHIYLYNISGDMLLDLKTDVRASGLPIDMAFSPDGQKLVTSYYGLGNEHESWLTFYNFGDVGQSYSDKIVGSFSFGNKIVAAIRFIGNDRICAICDDAVKLYAFKEIPEEKKTLEFSTGVEAFSANAKAFCVVSGTNAGSNDITVYSQDGEIRKKITTIVECETVNIYEDELVLTSGASCLIYRLKDGELKLTARLNDSLNLVLPTSDPSVYTAVGEQSIIQIKLKTQKDLKKELKAAGAETINAEVGTADASDAY